MKPIRTAILGLGRIAWRLELDKLRYHPCTHFGALRAAGLKSRFEVVGVCDVDANAVAEFTRWGRLKNCVMGDDASRVLQKSSPELVIVSASLDAHESLVKAAVAAGAQAIMLEKPPALTYAASRRMLRLCRDIPVWVNFERRYHPQYAYVRDLVQSAGMERVRSIRGRVLAGTAPGSPGSGPLLHDAIHWIDLLLWIAGSPRAAQARQLRKSAYAAEHTSFIRFDYRDFSATLESGGRRKYFEFEMEIDLDTIRLHCGNSGFRMLERKPSSRYSQFFELSASPMKLPRWQNPWVLVYSEIYSYLREQRNTMTSSLFNAVEAMRWIDRCSRA
jgi:predicted dehydrogenase